MKTCYTKIESATWWIMNGVVIPSNTAIKKNKIGESEYASFRSYARLRYSMLHSVHGLSKFSINSQCEVYEDECTHTGSDQEDKTNNHFM